MDAEIRLAPLAGHQYEGVELHSEVALLNRTHHCSAPGEANRSQEKAYLREFRQQMVGLVVTAHKSSELAKDFGCLDANIHARSDSAAKGEHVCRLSCVDTGHRDRAFSVRIDTKRLVVGHGHRDLDLAGGRSHFQLYGSRMPCFKNLIPASCTASR